jgi:hypothetical protein
LITRACRLYAHGFLTAFCSKAFCSKVDDVDGLTVATVREFRPELIETSWTEPERERERELEPELEPEREREPEPEPVGGLQRREPRATGWVPVKRVKLAVVRKAGPDASQAMTNLSKRLDIVLDRLTIESNEYD